MKDFAGTELNIGDHVAYVHPNGTAPGGSLKTSVVTRFTPKMIGIKGGWKGDKLLSPDKIIKL